MTETGPEDREQAVLEEIIQYYLQHHEAISARTLAKISRLALSPTTIRNLMEDLSDSGLLTSAGVPRGRIPTQKAFGIYVGRLGRPARQHSLRVPEVEQAQGALDLEQMLEGVGSALAHQSGCVVLAALPARDCYPLDWVQLAAVPRNQVLVTTRTLWGDLWSKLIATSAPFPDELLREVARFINEGYRASPLERVRRDIMAGEPKQLLASMPSLGAAFRMLRRAFEWQEGAEQRVWGREHMLPWWPEDGPGRQLLFLQALADPNLLERALEESRPVGAARISIGTETRYPGLEDCSVVAHPFGTGEWLGQLTVLGPMRMNYPHVLHLVGQGAQVLTDQLQARLPQAAAHAGQPQ